MKKPIRESIKLLLFNERNELLLMRVDDPNTKSSDGKYHGSFWILVGGEINKDEPFQEAALREIYEETGIEKEEIELGPLVWEGEFDLILHDVLTHLKQTFMVAYTKKQDISFANLDEREKKVLKQLKWFSLDDIKNSKEVIYPVVLEDYLPDIISKRLPKTLKVINLAKQPKK